MPIIPVRIDEELKRKMEKFAHANWSEVLRRTVAKRIALEEKLAARRRLNVDRLFSAVKDRLRSKTTGMAGRRGGSKMEGAGKAVIDASIAVKWYNIEGYTEECLRLRDDYVAGKIDILAPYLLLYEVGNALRRNPDFGAKDVGLALKDLLDMQIDLKFLDEAQCEAAARLAYDYAITIYDAVYLALALTNEAPLYTADERLLKKARVDGLKDIREY